MQSIQIQEQVTSAAIRGGAMGLSGGCEEVRWKQDGELRKRERRRRVWIVWLRRRGTVIKSYFSMSTV